ncbi:lipocalin-like domain-containing protein [Streptomyces platensis]|uniref:lipocalin-like domain-containing protein n=1 Tax=Streptomyces platensis TaxID=58346 RepID=UPI00224F6C8A|nr:lipocalin-like domain-containing protein [Streptomyces platensis]MCX4634060.1 lipocalin-like domain-containing protein [Streptomyces platensis]
MTTTTRPPVVRPEELIGAWELTSYVSVDEGGALGEGPLGPEPRGLLIYSADGRVSVSMMRGDPPPADREGPVPRFMGYAGTWRLSGRQVVHDVTVSSHGYLVGSRQTRRLVFDGALLTLSGSAGAAGGPPQERVLTWRRAGGGRS